MSTLCALPGSRFRLIQNGAALIPLRAREAAGLLLPIGAVVRCVGFYWPNDSPKTDSCRAFFAWEDCVGELSIWKEPAQGLDAGWVEEVL